MGKFSSMISSPPRPSGLRGLPAMLRGRIIAADPGRVRIRLASRATLAVVLGVVAGAALAALAGQPVTVAMFAAVVAMLSSTSVNDGSTPARALTTTLVPVVAGVATVLAAVLDARSPWLGDGVFVLVMGGATYVRRFGPRGMALGMVAFMGYFFALFLRAKPAQLPWLELAALVGTAMAAVVRFLLLPDRPRSDLRRMLRAFRGRAAAVADAVADLLESGPGARREHRLRRAVADLGQVALLIEQQLDKDEVAAAVDDVDRLRGLVFDAELTAEHLATAVRTDLPQLEPASAARLQRAAEALARAALAGGLVVPAVRALNPADEDAPALLSALVAAPADGRAEEAAAHLGRSLGRLAEELDELSFAAPGRRPDRHGAGAAAHAADDGSATRSAGGAVDVRGADAEESGPDGADESGGGSAEDFGPGGLSLPTRSAIQVCVAGALAIVAGQLISPQRWYWAVIAAFVVFANAPTRAATLRRATSRVFGTAVGVVGGLAVGALVAGDSRLEIALIFGCVFAAFWLFPVSYSVTIFFFTVMLALLYSLLGMLSTDLLALRLEETLVGALIGGVVATLLVPRSGGRAIDEGAEQLLGSVRDLLETVEHSDDTPRGRADIRAAARDVDQAFQDLRVTVRPAVAGVPGQTPRTRRHEMMLLGGLRYWSRLLAVEAVSGQADRLPPDAVRRLCENLDALAAWLRDGIGAPVRRIGVDDAHATTAVHAGEPLVDVGGGPGEATDLSGAAAPLQSHAHGLLALTRLDETVAGLAEARGVTLLDSTGALA